MSKHLALLIAYGPEVRAFIHSGLARRLAENYKVTVVARVPGSAVFNGANDFDVIGMPMTSESRVLGKLRSWALRSQQRWMRAQGRSSWSHYLSKSPGRHALSRRTTRPRSPIGARPWFTERIGTLERLCGTRFGTNVAWQRILTERSIDCVLAATYDSPYVLPALQTASNMGRRAIVVTNSWKDVYTTTRVAVVPSALVVQSREAARALLELNAHVRHDSVYVAKSLHLAPFSEQPPIPSREELCRRLGTDPSRPLICYTAAAPAAVVDEDLVVEALVELIRDGTIPGQPQVVLRMNPMEDGSRWARLEAGYPEVVLQRPLWEWDRAIDWCCALAGDIPLWTSLVAHAAVNVSIASTVTLEFAAYCKPVVNICFDLPGPKAAACSNERFWNAPFYSEIRERQLAMPTFSKADLAVRVSAALRQGEKDAAAVRLADETSPVQQVSDIVNHTLA